MGGGYREGPSVHVFASGANETADLVNRVGSGRDFRAQKPHERLLAVGSEGQDIVRPRRSTFHTGRSGGLPSTASPRLAGRCARSRRIACAGTWPSTTKPDTSAVWQEANDGGTRSRVRTALRSAVSSTVTANAAALHVLHPAAARAAAVRISMDKDGRRLCAGQLSNT